MLAPMVLLAAACAVIGLAPVVVVPILEPAIGAWAVLARTAPGTNFYFRGG